MFGEEMITGVNGYPGENFQWLVLLLWIKISPKTVNFPMFVCIQMWQNEENFVEKQVL